ncbi:MAG: hypothetical protein AAB906_04115 [Patescibacteria group bacterium]
MGQHLKVCGFDQFVQCPLVCLMAKELEKAKLQQSKDSDEQVRYYVDLAYDCSCKRPNFICVFDCLKKIKDVLTEYHNIGKKKMNTRVDDSRQPNLFVEKK